MFVFTSRVTISSDINRRKLAVAVKGNRSVTKDDFFSVKSHHSYDRIDGRNEGLCDEQLLNWSKSL